MATNVQNQPSKAPDAAFDTVSKAGWQRFTKFLLINVLVAIAALLIVGLLTVWS